MFGTILAQAVQALLAATLLPLGLLLSLSLVRLMSVVQRAVARFKPLPIVVHPLNFEHNMREFVTKQPPEMLELPSRVRDFISQDVTLRENLAPGPVSPIAPALSSVAPSDSSQNSWAHHLLELLYPRIQPAYNLILVPEVPNDGIALGAQIVETPKNRLVAARSFTAATISDLVLEIGSFCVENVLEQPGVLRRSPRWEHWSRGAYAEFRRAYVYQEAGEVDTAHAFYERAAALAPGNARIALHHASLHEGIGEFRKAATTYNAASCLWRQNIDMTYRLSAATINYVLTRPDLPPLTARRLILQANQALKGAQRRIAPWHLLKRVARTIHPRWRDPGERRYWYAWLRPDPYRSPLKLLRRSKGHEYRAALTVANSSNAILLYTAAGGAHCPKDPDPAVLWRIITQVVDKKRSGWLAHWSAACFFSRAMELPIEHQPEEYLWRSDARRVSRASLSRFKLAFDDLEIDQSEPDWQRYCSERAIAELGRVVRNPCNQLDRQLLEKDPDMQRLRKASGQHVGVLAGLGGTESNPSETAR
jgi:hypothetical protein